MDELSKLVWELRKINQCISFWYEFHPAPLRSTPYSQGQWDRGIQSFRRD